MLFKFLHIINIITLLFATTGVAFHKHYCQDKLKSISVFTKTTSSCCKNNVIICEKKLPLSSLEGCTVANKDKCKEEKNLGKYKTTISKRHCCLNQFEYSNGSLIARVALSDNALTFYSSIFIFFDLPTLSEIIYYYYPSNNRMLFGRVKYIPPLRTSLFILYESFLC